MRVLTRADTLAPLWPPVKSQPRRHLWADGGTPSQPLSPAQKCALIADCLPVANGLLPAVGGKKAERRKRNLVGKREEKQERKGMRREWQERTDALSEVLMHEQSVALLEEIHKRTAGWRLPDFDNHLPPLSLLSHPVTAGGSSPFRTLCQALGRQEERKGRLPSCPAGNLRYKEREYICKRKYDR